MLTITEANVGRSQGEILYPHVSTCMTLTLQLQNGRLVGAHLSAADPSDLLEWILEEMVGLVGGEHVRRVYAVGVINAWTLRNQQVEVDGCLSFVWNNFADSVRAALDLGNQLVFAYDSRQVAAVTHIRVAPALMGHCRIKVASQHLYALQPGILAHDDEVFSVRGGTSSFGQVYPRMIDGGSAPMTLVKRSNLNNLTRTVKVLDDHHYGQA